MRIDNSQKIILDLCGGTGAWSNPYREAGYDVYSITLPEHDVRTYVPPDNVYGILAAPPCTEFSHSKSVGKPRDIIAGMEIVRACLEIIWKCQYKLPTPLAKRTNLKFWALENPFGLLRRYLGHPVLIFNPYDYGNPYQKRTCLWGFFNIPKKNPIVLTPIEQALANRNSQDLPERYIGKYKEIKHLSLIKRRAITPPGFAAAFFKANR